MNSKAFSLIKNFSYTLSSNLISLIVSTVVVLIIPKLIGVKEYGFWQLYLFYSSYVGFMHFGWNDGIYLRYGGKEYCELDKRLFLSQFLMLLGTQVIFSLLIFLCSNFITGDNNRLFILQMVGLIMVLVNTRYMLLSILQATNRIKNYAQIIMMDRVIYIFLIIFFLLIGARQYKLMIIADFAGKLLSLIYAIYCCREFTLYRISTFYFSFSETFRNISVGIKLMIANIASMMIIGVIQFGIERSWDVATFGKVSLTLTITNMTALFIDAVGLVMFPLLRRTNPNNLSNIYSTMRNFLMIILLGILIVYYPIKVIMSAWLPQYAQSLIYMALVFPIFIYEGKMALLINTYLKTLRKEKIMLKINITSMVLSIVFTLISTQIFKSLYLAIVSIIILLAFRCILAEIYLSTIIRILVFKDIMLELSLTIIFIISGWFINSWDTMIIYAIAYIVYVVIKRNSIVETANNVKLLMNA